VIQACSFDLEINRKVEKIYKFFSGGSFFKSASVLCCNGTRVYVPNTPRVYAKMCCIYDAGLQARAGEIMADMRNCRPAPGFDRVDVPGQRERRVRAESNGIIAIPAATWRAILALRDRCVSSNGLDD